MTMTGQESERQREIFEKLYHATRSDLLAYILRRSQTAEDAADILADTYMVAWQRLETIPPGDEARPWLFGVARKFLLKGSTRRCAAYALVERLAQELHRIQSEAMQTTATREHPRTLALRAALHTLSEIDREILTLAAWEGLKPRQIATVMGLSPNTVRVRLYRARSRLRCELGSVRDRELGVKPARAVEEHP